MEEMFFENAQESSYHQSVEKPFTEPSAKSVVRLFNRLNDVNMYYRNQGALDRSVFDRI